MLNVCLVSADHPRHTYNRMVGWFGYQVENIGLIHKTYKDKFVSLNRNDFKDFDAVIVEDARLSVFWNGYNNNTAFCYLIVDSVLSKDHYRERHNNSLQYDINLVDQDKLSRFPRSRRFSYCVNENIFKPAEKIYDVGMLFNATPERNQLRDELTLWCNEHGYSFVNGRRVEDYPLVLAQSKININLSRNPSVRSHRVFDVMACNSMLITSTLPKIDYEYKVKHKDYEEFSSFEGLTELIDTHLKFEIWKDKANSGFELVKNNHTWENRANLLVNILQGT